ncbi:TPA: hypothetical protein N0F65_009198 [Lagenidium giganteum]|uniref:tRNA pseudouridine synthase n=1 Tax=Lagenidium giganteum TaxID=4803 RepID=A0AAV2YRH8_9STRA|nr:TPA: hypothetical protein N0F65_009198 [Lagenidium giganteum]
MAENDQSDVKLSRSERKRRFKEQSQSSKNDQSAPQAKRRVPNMPAHCFLPLSAEDIPATQWRAVIEYDGTNFNGSQAQDGADSMRTVQQVIEDALLRTTGETLRIRAASRTDKGVHARGQVIAFKSRCTADAEVFQNALNNRLSDDVRCQQLERVDAAGGEFDPRSHSKSKTYEYVIVNGPLRPVMDRHRVWHVKPHLDELKMQQAIDHFLAPPRAKDYSSFTPQKSVDEGDNVCELEAIELKVQEVHAHDEDTQPERRVRIVVRGNRFLYKMVRNLVGTLVDVGLGRIDPDKIPDILAAKTRGKAGQGAPPQGLTLMHIRYP